MPTASAQIMILLPIFSLLAFVAMPVVAIALYGKFDGGESNVYPEWHFRKLALWRQATRFERSKHGCFDTADSRVSLLSKVSIATIRAGTKAANEAGLYMADFATHLALHFDFWFVQRVVFANDCFGLVARGASLRAARCFVVWRTLELLAALWASLGEARQSSMCRFVGAVGASAGTKLTIRIVSFMRELFAARRAYVNGILLAGFNATRFTPTCQGTIMLLPTACLESLAAMLACFGVLGLHKNASCQLGVSTFA